MGQMLLQWLSNPANQFICIVGLIALIIGFCAGLLVRRAQAGKEQALAREGDKAFFKGIQYILSNDHDHAIEEFTKSVQLNSDTIETYVALGNLYRSKGDIDRAIRIRQNIILRPHIDDQIKLRALLDLGMDYRKGGFLNRALETFLKVLQRQPENLETLREVERIYEEMQDWEHAFATRQKISQLTREDDRHILAHQQTELGKIYQEKNDFSAAKSCFKKAVSIYEGCVDAYLHLGDLYFGKQDYKNAMATWKKVAVVAPQLTFLAYRRLEDAYGKMQNLKPVEEFLRECAQVSSDAFTHLALARYLYNERDYDGALRELESALDLDPAFWEARKLMGRIFLSQGQKEEALAAYKDLIDHLNVPYLQFQCNHCGYTQVELQWQCPQCRRWDTMELIYSRTADPDLSQPLQIPADHASAPESPEEACTT